MIINSAPEPHVVDEYDFLFATGLVYPITLDKAAGDSAELDHHQAVFHIAEKPSLTDPERRTPAEKITIFMPHVLSVTHRTRAIVPPTPEQKDQFQKTLHALSKTIQ